MTKENFLDKWIEALPLNSKDADRKEMAYDIDLMLKKQALSLGDVSDCDFCVDGKVDKPQYICEECEELFLNGSGR